MTFATALRSCVLFVTLLTYDAYRKKIDGQARVSANDTQPGAAPPPLFDPAVLAAVRNLERKGHFTVFTFNLWGHPGKPDKRKVLSPERVRNSMNLLMEEVNSLHPWVVGFQEYSRRAFDSTLDPLWKQYSGCSMSASGVRIGVRSDVECRIGKVQDFADLPDCGKLPKAHYARSYQNVEIKVDSTWVNVAVLHLMSGRGASGCKKASLGHSFKTIVEEDRPGVVMGDMNWFSKDFQKGIDSVPITKVPHVEHFSDAAALDGRATFPAWDPDLKTPASRHAARLDRVFYTAKGLETEAYVLVNKKADGYEGKYAFISDHVGSFVSFKLSSSRDERTLSERFAEEFSLDGPFPWHLWDK